MTGDPGDDSWWNPDDDRSETFDRQALPEVAPTSPPRLAPLGTDWWDGPADGDERPAPNEPSRDLSPEPGVSDRAQSPLGGDSFGAAPSRWPPVNSGTAAEGHVQPIRGALRRQPWRQIAAAALLAVVSVAGASMSWAKVLRPDEAVVAKVKLAAGDVESAAPVNRSQRAVGEDRVELPDVTRLTRQQAVETLVEAGVAEKQIAFKDVPHVEAAGTVVRQAPPGGTDDPEGAITLELAVASKMPNLLGKGEDEAIAGLATLGVEPTINREFRFGQELGVVVNQEPAADAALAADSSIVVSEAGADVAPGDLQPTGNDCSSGSVLVGATEQDAPIVCSPYSGATEADATGYVLGSELGSFEATVVGSGDNPPGESVAVRIIVDNVVVQTVNVTAASSETVTVDLTGKQRLDISIGPRPASSTASSTSFKVGFVGATFKTSQEIAARIGGD